MLALRAAEAAAVVIYILAVACSMFVRGAECDELWTGGRGCQAAEIAAGSRGAIHGRAYGRPTEPAAGLCCGAVSMSSMGCLYSAPRIESQVY